VSKENGEENGKKNEDIDEERINYLILMRQTEEAAAMLHEKGET
jgi:hypothetical protein